LIVPSISKRPVISLREGMKISTVFIFVLLESSKVFFN
jgi:hypothetical protein